MRRVETGTSCPRRLLDRHDRPSALANCVICTTVHHTLTRVARQRTGAEGAKHRACDTAYACRNQLLTHNSRGISEGPRASISPTIQLSGGKEHKTTASVSQTSLDRIFCLWCSWSHSFGSPHYRPQPARTAHQLHYRSVLACAGQWSSLHCSVPSSPIHHRRPVLYRVPAPRHSGAQFSPTSSSHHLPPPPIRRPSTPPPPWCTANPHRAGNKKSLLPTRIPIFFPKR